MKKSNLLTALNRLSERTEVRRVVVEAVLDELRKGELTLDKFGVDDAVSLRYPALPYPAKRWVDDLSVSGRNKLALDVLSTLQGEQNV